MYEGFYGGVEVYSVVWVRFYVCACEEVSSYVDFYTELEVYDVSEAVFFVVCPDACVSD